MPLELDGYSAFVRCGKEELEIYGVKKEDDKTVSCWIASEAGKPFSVHWCDRPEGTTMRVVLEVDGRKAYNSAHIKESRSNGSVGGAPDGPGQIRPFQFAPLVLTDDDNVAHSATRCAELGTIRFTMTNVQRFVETDTPYVAHYAYDLQPIHEKSKKAGIHAVSFGPAVPVSASHTMNTIGEEKEPFATFIFRYRPLGLLQANGIVPAQMSSAPIDQESNRSQKRRREGSSLEDEIDIADIKSDPEDDDDDDLTELQQQLAAIQRRIEAKAAKKSTRKRKIKREVSPIRVPSSSSRESEVIDLT